MDVIAVIAFYCALPLILSALLQDPLAHNIPDDIPGSEPDDSCLFEEAER